MHRDWNRLFRLFAILFAISSLATTGAGPAIATIQTSWQRYIVRAANAADYAALHMTLAQAGSQIILDRPDLELMVVNAPQSTQVLLSQSQPAAMAPDQVETLSATGNGHSPVPLQTRPVRVGLPGPSSPQTVPAQPNTVTPDPLFNQAGTLWNMAAIHAPQTWQKPVGLGAGYVLVGVIDTGLDYTHLDLRNKVARVVDFTTNDDPNLCAQRALPTDAELAIAFGAPSADIDFNGHGSTVGGVIAAGINLTGTNGVAPGVGLVALKVAQNCGLAYDSDILSAILYAADNGIDIVTLTFSHYVNRSDPAQDTLYQAYAQVMAYALAKGTVVVAGAGDEHARVGASGQVIGHGALSAPPGGADDFGLWQIPGGIPGVLDVSATDNLANPSSSTCPPDSLAAGSHQWCKLNSDAHQPGGAGRHNQLAYYSNYGPRIDLAAPGGSRKFNLPDIDRGGAEGWPWTGIDSVEGGTSAADGFNAWQVFSITSDFATAIPCFTFTGSSIFPPNQCYAIQEGTALASAHVAAALAVAAGALPSQWRRPIELIAFIKGHTTALSGNGTAPLSATDKSAGDLGGGACTNGYCHLGGSAIPDREAYGSGLLDDFGPYWPKLFVPLLVR